MVHFAIESVVHQRQADDSVEAPSTSPKALDVVASGDNDAASLERLGDSIAELAAHLHAATYRLLVMLADFDRRGGWGGGFRSCAHWLSWRTRLNLGAAREKVRVARALERLPLVSDAFGRGELSYAVVRAVTRIATPENETELLQLARNGTASHVEKVVRAWRRVDRLEEQWAERERHRSRYLHLYPDEDGMYVLRGRLTPEAGALLERALAAATEVLYQQPEAAPSLHGGPTSYAQREADAIGLLAEWALGGERAESVEQRAETPADDPTALIYGQSNTIEDRKRPSVLPDDVAVVNVREHQSAPLGDTPAAESAPVNRNTRSKSLRTRPANASRAERFQVVIHVDAAALRAASETGQAVLAGGIRVSAETCRRIACDSSRFLMVHGANGNVLDVGRRTRAVPTPIRRALEQRDGGCRFPGCNRRICDAHHIEHWADGGKTKLSNLTLLCPFHHRAVHEDGFRVHSAASGELMFMRPDGRPIPEAPALPALAEGAVARLVAAHEEFGVDIDPWTATPPWQGERLDLDYALRALRAL